MSKAVYHSPLGAISLAAEGSALISATFTDEATERASDDPVLIAAAVWLDRYFEGRDPGPVPPCRPFGTPFQKAVWNALLTVPYGETVSYAELAKRAGFSVRHARAIGGAVHNNPVALFIPCHRVIGADGSLIGYAAGLERKQALLELEQRKGEGMEEQIIKITIKSRGEACEMTDTELKAWYERKIAEFFDPKLGMPEITVKVERTRT